MEIKDGGGGLAIVWLNSAIRFECSHGSVSPVPVHSICEVRNFTTHTSLPILTDILNSQCKRGHLMQQMQRSFVVC